MIKKLLVFFIISMIVTGVIAVTCVKEATVALTVHDFRLEYLSKVMGGDGNESFITKEGYKYTIDTIDDFDETKSIFKVL